MQPQSMRYDLNHHAQQPAPGCSDRQRRQENTCKQFNVQCSARTEGGDLLHVVEDWECASVTPPPPEPPHTHIMCR